MFIILLGPRGRAYSVFGRGSFNDWKAEPKRQ